MSLTTAQTFKEIPTKRGICFATTFFRAATIFALCFYCDGGYFPNSEQKERILADNFGIIGCVSFWDGCCFFRTFWVLAS